MSAVLHARVIGEGRMVEVVSVDSASEMVKESFVKLLIRSESGKMEPTGPVKLKPEGLTIKPVSGGIS